MSQSTSISYQLSILCIQYLHANSYDIKEIIIEKRDKLLSTLPPHQRKLAEMDWDYQEDDYLYEKNQIAYQQLCKSLDPIF